LSIYKRQTDAPAAETLLAKYQLPEWQRRHVEIVRDVAREVADAYARRGGRVDVERVTAAAWLHDIGRSPLLAGDPRDHAELSAIILSAEGLPELAEMARRHPVYTILDPERAPRTLEEKIVHYADRRGGLAIVSLDERLREQAVRYPAFAATLERCLPLEKALERELLAPLGFAPESVGAGSQGPGAGVPGTPV